MIIKLIAAKSKPKEAERYARHLARYMAEGDRRWLGPDAVGMDYGLTLSSYMTSPSANLEQTGERVLFKGALVGGMVKDWETGQADVERRLARRSRKVKKPVRHGVMSCRPGERLTEEGCSSAIATLAAELGCDAAAILWAAHGDTDNFHLHFMFVTVDPEAGGALPFGQLPDGRAGYREAMQRAIARIERQQTLQSEPGARYRVEGDEVVRVAEPRTHTDPPERKRAPIRQEILDWEARSGFVSFTRFAQDVAGPLLDIAGSWAQLHHDLAPHGIGVRRAVNGGELYAGDERVKLSAVDRRHSWKKLVDRLGPYEKPEGIQLTSYKPVIADAGKAGRWLLHSRQARDIGQRVDERLATLMAARDAALGDAEARLSAHRADASAFDGDDRLRRDLTAAWPRLRSSMLASIRTAFSARIEAVRRLRHAAAAAHDLDGVDLDAIGMPDLGIVAPWQAGGTTPPVVALNGFRGERQGRVVRYWSNGDRTRQGSPAMVDDGAIIWVNDGLDRTVEAALILGRKRFGDVAVFGDAGYVEQCRRVAERLGFEIEVISAAEARRRARQSSRREEARRRAFESLSDRGDRLRIDTRERRRIWARAYELATPKEDPSAQSEALMTGDILHHLDIATQGEGASARKPTPHILEESSPSKVAGRALFDRAGGMDR